MSDTLNPMRDLLADELDLELERTRRTLERLPEGHNDFKLHERSMPLWQLANHTASLGGFAAPVLLHPSINMASPEDTRRILRTTTKDELLLGFAEVAAASRAAMKDTADSAFSEPFTLLRAGVPVMTNTRYFALRTLCLNHMIHHRAQLGSSLRQLNVPVPGHYGPSADEK